jgi:hypothetical protein
VSAFLTGRNAQGSAERWFGAPPVVLQGQRFTWQAANTVLRWRTQYRVAVDVRPV